MARLSVVAMEVHHRESRIDNMSLRIRTAPQFLHQDRLRGEEYYHNDRAFVWAQEEQLYRGEVTGSGDDFYEVEIDLQQLQRGVVIGSCTCPRFTDGYLCKHLWASLLEVDDETDGLDDLPDAGRGNLRFHRPRANRPERVVGHAVDVPEDSLATADSDAPGGDVSGWKQQFGMLEKAVQTGVTKGISPTITAIQANESEVLFCICLEDCLESSRLKLRSYRRDRKPGEEWGVPRQASFTRYAQRFLTPEERQIFSMLQGETGHEIPTLQFTVPPGVGETLLPRLANASRLFWSMYPEQHLHDATGLDWDSAGSWQLRLKFTLKGTRKSGQVSVTPLLQRADETVEWHSVVGAYQDGFILMTDRIGQITPQDAAWVRAMQQNDDLTVPAAEFDEFFDRFNRLSDVPSLDLDKRLGTVAEAAMPRGKAIVADSGVYDRLNLDVMASYDGHEVELGHPQRSFWNSEAKELQVRDFDAENALAQQLVPFAVDLVPVSGQGQSPFVISPRQLPELTRKLLDAGWEVVAHGKLHRAAKSFEVEVQSNVDWFDLHADVDFDGASASLPALLAAVRQKRNHVVLDDGSIGLLPEEWLSRYSQFAEVGQANGETIRFSKSQALFLDAMLAEQEGVRLDRDFTTLCKRLHAFDGIKRGKAPRSFRGELREYQQDGLGWMRFLREFEFGGCLADDMGLGKTVQVLAMLQSRKSRRLRQDETRLPSIAVVPKSLIFNWIEEAERFTPNLKTVNYTGLQRADALSAADDYDLLITTYGTLRRDIEQLQVMEFDYAILDESQAIKNAKSQASRACRLLLARHRLAMTGTPIENHLGELWSLFDFLNPGMLGTSEAFRRVARNGSDDPEALKQLGQALRPFLLRRTKEQVLTELPAKSEQTLHCEMSAKQARKYKQLRDHYRVHLSNKVEEHGIKRSKIHVLEALLRLRQAACDPRLLDAKEVPGAKIELLVEQLEGILKEGHKALVFSQFTSLLRLVRDEVTQREWAFEYLDGKTRKRGECVKRFQEDPECQLFLISLKAGGHGLNLTAADYVYILDPWWNPAVEAQAIDRAHRMGQTNPVMAYRIICRDTVEDKIVELQKSKRKMADAIVTANESLISKLSFEDLQMLLT